VEGFKMRRIAAVFFAVVLVLVFAVGCTARDRGNYVDRDAQEEANGSGAVSIPESSVPELPRTDQERPVIEPLELRDIEERDEDSIDEPEDAEETAQTVMSTDIDTDTLSSNKVKWGAGLRMDENGRPAEPVELQERYGRLGGLFIAPNNQNIYLTFDEGYENSYTGDMLDTLKEKDVKAVFFITYQYAKSEPELVRRMVEEGHILGNHSTAHKSFPDLSEEEAIQDIMTLHDYVKANYGYTMSLFRPPMGEFSERTLALAKSIGYTTVLWSFAYMDWDVNNQPISIQALDIINTRCHNGAILLLHAVSRTNAEILGEAIDSLRGKGFIFARLDWV